MSRKQPAVELMLTVISHDTGLFLSVGVSNRSDADVTVVTLARYLTIELKNDRGQFVQGQETESAIRFPTADDYLVIEKTSERSDVFRFHITPETVGTLKFPRVPRRNEVRVTYKADRIMPNLPSKSRKNFFAGPTAPNSTAIELP